MGIKTSLQSIGIRQALGYLERNPEENLPKLMAWVDRFAGDRPDSFPQQRAVIRKVVNDPTNNWYRFYHKFGEERGQRGAQDRVHQF